MFTAKERITINGRLAAYEGETMTDEEAAKRGLLAEPEPEPVAEETADEPEAPEVEPEAEEAEPEAEEPETEPVAEAPEKPKRTRRAKKAEEA